MVMYATLVVFQRDLDVIAMVVGQVRRLLQSCVYCMCIGNEAHGRICMVIM